MTGASTIPAVSRNHSGSRPDRLQSSHRTRAVPSATLPGRPRPPPPDVPTSRQPDIPTSQSGTPGQGPPRETLSGTPGAGVKRTRVTP